MVGLKHLAACVLVAGGLMAGAGGLALRADGDPPPPKTALPKVEAPKPTADPKPFGVFTGRQEWAGPRWEHQSVDKPTSREAFDLLLATRGKDGWEFAGLVSWQTNLPGQPTEVLVFKRPSGGPAAVATLPDLARPRAEVRQSVIDNLRPVVVATLAKNPDISFDRVFEAVREAQGDDRIGNPTPAEVNALRAAVERDRRPTVPATVGGFQAIPLKHAKAADVARTVRELFVPGLRLGAEEIYPMVLSADDGRNLVLFRTSHQPTQDAVRKLVAELDVPAK